MLIGSETIHNGFLVNKSKTIMFIPWLSMTSCILAILMFSGLMWMAMIFFPLAYVTLLLVIATTSRSWMDWLNPIILIIGIGFVRFSLPGILLLVTHPEIHIFQMMHLESDDLILAHALALFGLLCVVIGWFIRVKFANVIIRQIFTSLNLHSSEGVYYAAIIGMIIGFSSLLLFIGNNVNIVEVIFSGEFRATKIHEGSGKFFRLSLVLIASSVVLSDYAIRRKYIWWKALFPIFAATISFWVLGGRVRAFVPFAAGLLLLWYQKGNFRVSAKCVWIAAVILLPVFSFAGQLYRGGGGIEGIRQVVSIPALLEYIKWAIWVDWGQLHSLAGATAIEPGTLGGRTFLTLLWPLSDILNLPAKSAGVFITQTLSDVGDRKWGFHATLIGDAYLNFGIIGVFLVMTIFGMGLNALYTEMRRGLVNNAIYGLVIVYNIRIFFESIEKGTEALTIFVFTVFIIKLGQFLFDILPYKK